MYWAESLSQLGSEMLAGSFFGGLQLALQFGFFVVLLEKSWVSVRTVILSRVCVFFGMRILRVRGMRRLLVLCSLALSVPLDGVSRFVLYILRVGYSSFCVCCCVENPFLNFYIVFDVMVFVDCAVYLSRGSLFSFSLLGGRKKGGREQREIHV